MKKKIDKVTHRARVFYTGRVQGIGFRYTAEEIALEIGVVGCVKNLPDGRVELIGEGGQEDIKLLLERIRTGSLGPYITKVDCRWEKPSQSFKDFSVEFCH